MSMSVEYALIRLEFLGSDIDPIWVKGVETTPRDVGYEYEYHPSHLSNCARRVYITYHGHNGLIHGTLSGMVKDREQLLKET